MNDVDQRIKDAGPEIVQACEHAVQSLNQFLETIEPAIQEMYDEYRRLETEGLISCPWPPETHPDYALESELRDPDRLSAWMCEGIGSDADADPVQT